VACSAIGGNRATSGDFRQGNDQSHFPIVFAATICLIFALSSNNLAWAEEGQTDSVSVETKTLEISDYDQLVLKAREGDTEPALATLRQLGEEASLSQRFDHILIASWAGLNEEVVAVYDALPTHDPNLLPAQVIATVARSLRDLKRWPQALELWQLGLETEEGKIAAGENGSQEVMIFAPGLIMTLADSGQPQEAIHRGEEFLKLYPDLSELKQALTYAGNVQQRLENEREEREREEARRAYDALIIRARDGDTAPALAFLRQLGETATPAQRFDHLIVASWAGLTDEVLRLYHSLPQNLQQAMPANAQVAVARILRERQDWRTATQILREGLRQQPQDSALLVPHLVMSLSDSGQEEEAIKIGLNFLKNNPNDAELHMALAYVYTKLQRPFDVLYHTDQAFKLMPQASWIEDEYIRALTRAGLSEQALERARKTGRFQGSALRAIEADAIAVQTRLSAMPTRSEGERFVIADRALARYGQMLEDWRALGQAAAADVTRIRIDRLAALHARFYMDELVRDYESLLKEGVQVPVWALSNVASAYLYLRQPQTAGDLYRAILKNLEETTKQEDWDKLGPANARLNNEIGLMYAFIEAEQFDQLPPILARIEAYKPGWLYYKNNPQPAPNTNYLDAKVALIAADQARDDMPLAQKKLEKMVELAPENTNLRTNLAGVYRARAQPRLAEHHLKIAETQEPRSLGVEVGQGLVAIDLQEWRQAEELSRDALARFPEDQSARRLARLWQVHNMAEWRVSSNHSLATNSSSINPVSGRGNFGVETVLYSRPIDYNWRAFISGGYTQGRYREGRGHATTLLGGLEWRSRNLWLEAEVSSQNYGQGTKAGARLSGLYDLNDHWQIGGNFEYRAGATPLRALREGISSNIAAATLRWRANERHEWAGTLSSTRFSDDNDRWNLDLNGVHRLYTTPNIKFDLLMSASIQNNSKDADRPYFNPKRDLTFVPALRVTQRLYRHYENVWEHFVTLSVGAHDQKHYGTDEIWDVAYGQRYRYNDVLELGATLDYLSRSYDGERESEWRLLLDLTSRF